MKIVNLMLLFLLLLALPKTADAMLVGVDLIPSSQDALLTHDTESGLYWLDLTYTVGHSVWDILLNTVPGEDFSEFRYATIGEVDELFDHAGYDLFLDAMRGSHDTTEVQNMSKLISLFGTTLIETDPQPGGVIWITNWSRGWADPDKGHAYYADLVSFEYSVVIPSGSISALSSHVSDAWPNSFTNWKGVPVGHLLVKETHGVIPELPSIIIFSMGLLCIFSGRVVRQRHG